MIFVAIGPHRTLVTTRLRQEIELGGMTSVEPQSGLDRLRHLAQLRSGPTRRLYVRELTRARYRVELRTRDRRSFGFDNYDDAETFIRSYEPY